MENRAPILAIGFVFVILLVVVIKMVLLPLVHYVDRIEEQCITQHGEEYCRTTLQ